MIISFAWTSPALKAGRKTVTRRDWSPDYAMRFKAGQLVTAYDHSPRQHGKPIAEIRLTCAPRYEPDFDTPDGDFEGEGFAFFEEHPELLPKAGREEYRVATSRAGFDDWRAAGGHSWVVRFEVMKVF